MKYRVNDLKLHIGEGIEKLKPLIEKKYKCKVDSLEVIKEGLDARKKPDLLYVYTVDFVTSKKLNLPIAKDYTYVNPIAKDKNKRVIVVGFGPSGMFSSLILARAGLKVTVLEMGEDVDSRTLTLKHFLSKGELNPHSNVQFGEGGAGTFSDGKLTTGIKDDRIRFVLKEFVKFGADKDIMYKGKPHIGTDVLRKIVKNIRGEILSLGSEIKFSSMLTDIIVDDNKVKKIEYLDLKTDAKKEMDCDYLILGIGNSARSTFRLLKDMGINMERKPFSIGFRIEHSQDLIDISQYGKTSKELGIEPATYKLNTITSNGRGVYTFCMCPGGYVINASSAYGMVCVNGMSERKRDSGKANSAILCDVRVDDFPTDDVLSGIDFQEKYERIAYSGNYDIPTNTIKNYLNCDAKNISDCVPKFANDSIREAIGIFGKKIKGFDNPDGILRAVETRSSCPIRILRDDMGRSNISNLYPIGEGAGYAGGIMSSAVDGIKASERIIGDINE